jgi:hypothetical protein
MFRTGRKAGFAVPSAGDVRRDHSQFQAEVREALIAMPVYAPGGS